MVRPIPRQVRYTTLGFSIDDHDVVQLWTYLLSLLESPPTDCELVRISKAIEGQEATDDGSESTKQEDIQGFFENPNLPSRLSGFKLSFDATYKGRDSKGPFQVTRRVGLNIDPSKKSEVVIAGEPEWIPIVRDYLDPFIENHRRSTTGQIATLVIAFWVTPIALFVLAAIKFSTSYLTVGAVVWGGVGGLILLIALEGKFPESVIITRQSGRDEPWYIRRTNEVLVATVAAIFVGVIFYLAPV